MPNLFLFLFGLPCLWGQVVNPSLWLYINGPDCTNGGSPSVTTGNYFPWGLAWKPDMSSLFVSTGGIFPADCITRYDFAGGDTSLTPTIGCQQCSGYAGDLVYFVDSQGNERLIAGDMSGVNNKLYEYDPQTCLWMQSVMVTFPGAAGQILGVRRDPRSGDIFAANAGYGIYRFTPPPRNQTTTSFTLFFNYTTEIDGIHFAPDGTLFGAAPGNGILHISVPSDPTQQGTSLPTYSFDQSTYGDQDGLATCGGHVVVNSNNGYLVEYDTTGATSTSIYQATYRGDWATTGADGCVYATFEDQGGNNVACGQAILRGPCGCDPDSPVCLTSCPSNVCGSISNNCGGTLQCGGCTLPYQTCGGGGTPNACGCTPKTCSTVTGSCGIISDGCGGTLNCGGCTSPQNCGGGGTDNVCGCQPLTCCPSGFTCGNISDNCGGTITCGVCKGHKDFVCGGKGDDNVCGCNGTTSEPTIALSASAVNATEGQSVTFTATVHFTATPSDLTTSDFAIEQQGNNRPVTCIKESLIETQTQATFLCTSNTLPLGNHKYHAILSADQACVEPGESNEVKIHIRNPNSEGGNSHGGGNNKGKN